MTGKVFVDTNVLVYARDIADPPKHAAARAWMTALWVDDRGRTSFQVLHEFYATALRRFRGTTVPQRVREDIVRLAAWNPVAPTIRLVEQAWRIEDRFGVPWWDALIVAAAQEASARYLLSEDFQHGQAFGDLTIVDPFRVAPTDVP